MMIEAAIRGSIGSVAIVMRVLRGRVFFDVLDTTFLTPVWDPQEPDTLLRVTESYKVPGSPACFQGYEIADNAIDYWFMRTWDAEGETWFVPLPVGTSFEAEIDDARSAKHNLGFVPIVWVRNLPGRPHRRRYDGAAHSAPQSKHRSRSTTSSAKPAAA